MRPTYYCKAAPDVEVGDDIITIKPVYSVEIDFVVTPHVLRQIVARYCRALEEWDGRQKCKIIPFERANIAEKLGAS